MVADEPGGAGDVEVEKVGSEAAEAGTGGGEKAGRSESEREASREGAGGV